MNGEILKGNWVGIAYDHDRLFTKQLCVERSIKAKFSQSSELNAV